MLFRVEQNFKNSSLSWIDLCDDFDIEFNRQGSSQPILCLMELSSTKIFFAKKKLPLDAIVANKELNSEIFSQSDFLRIKD